MNYLFNVKTLVSSLGLAVCLSACGGGGSSTPDNSTRSSSSAASSISSSPTGSSVTSSSEISVSSETNMASESSLAVSSSSEASASSQASSSALPTHASNGTIYCTAAATDADGDGWGWEEPSGGAGFSCLVRNSVPDPDKGDFEGCIIGTLSWNYCATDNGSWGVAEGEVCISQSFCPANRSETQIALSETLVTPNASATTQAVYEYLLSIWGNKTLSGQQDLTWQDSTDMYQRVINDTGKAPAVMGYDYMNYRYTNGSGLQQTEEAIAHWDRGGLVTFCWHWRDPSLTTDAFYSADTDFQIPMVNGQLDTGSPVFANMNSDIDQIAAELKVLQEAGVVVLWRPLHEASGGWFWWGRPRTDGISPAYAQVVLWRHLYERMVNHHGLTNLIWVWNGQGAAWYPGDNYVDIVSLDIYDGAQNYESQIDAYNTTKLYPLQVKPVALSENSNIPDPDAIADDGAWWLWFVVWNDGNSAEGVTSSNNFWTGEHYNTNAHKTKVYNHPNIITLDDLPEF